MADNIPLNRQSGANLTKTKDDIKKAAQEIIRLKKKRAEINADIASQRAKVETYGIPKRAFDAALAYFEAEEDKQRDFDAGYQIVREALGVQMDLFTAADASTDSDQRRAPKPDVVSALPPRDEAKVADITAKEQAEGATILADGVAKPPAAPAEIKTGKPMSQSEKVKAANKAAGLAN